MKIKYLLILCSFLFTVRLSANTDQQFQQANQAYKNNQFDQAITQYEVLINEGYSSEELFYNLGNSYYRKNNLGKAILYFEKALAIDSNDEEVLHNLKVAKSKSKNEITPLPAFFLARWWAAIRGLLSSTLWGAIGLILFWTGVGGLVYWLLAAVRQQKKKGFVGGAFLLLASVLPFALAYSHANWERNSHMAIVQTGEISLRSAPDAESNEIIQIYEGLKVELLDEIGSWSKVRLMNGEQGWLPMDSFERI